MPKTPRFCNRCGERLAADDGRDARKTITAVFGDLVGSTSSGERLDPEVLRVVLRRYFAEMRDAIESYGGKVEKFIGDAVVGVFGSEAAHEDDAAGAVLAADEMRRRLASLNDTLPATGG
jgi:class 3 adenylate cyclase